MKFKRVNPHLTFVFLPVMPAGRLSFRCFVWPSSLLSLPSLLQLCTNIFSFRISSPPFRSRFSQPMHGQLCVWTFFWKKKNLFLFVLVVICFLFLIRVTGGGILSEYPTIYVGPRTSEEHLFGKRKRAARIIQRGFLAWTKI